MYMYLRAFQTDEGGSGYGYSEYGVKRKVSGREFFKGINTEKIGNLPKWACFVSEGKENKVNKCILDSNAVNEEAVLKSFQSYYMKLEKGNLT